MSKKMVYFYPSTATASSDRAPRVSIFEKSSAKASGFVVIGHCDIESAMAIHKSWTWMSEEDYTRWDEDGTDPTLYQVFTRSEWQKTLKFRGAFPTDGEARAFVEKLRADPVEFLEEHKIELPLELQPSDFG